MITLSELNQMNQEAFTDTLGEIFEHTPEIAAQTWQKRPFSTLETLYQAMVTEVDHLSDQDQRKLICAHPDLGSKAKMAEASVEEQGNLGLNLLNLEEYEHFQQLNQVYKEKFGFPFIVAVKNHTQETILESFSQRLQNTLTEEKAQALTEIKKIAQFRLESLIQVEN